MNREPLQNRRGPASSTSSADGSSSVAEAVTERLAPHLGDFNAQVWVRTIAQKKLSKAPEELQAGDLEGLLEGLRPSLNTLLGRRATGDLLQRIAREVG